MRQKSISATTPLAIDCSFAVVVVAISRFEKQMISFGEKTKLDHRRCHFQIIFFLLIYFREQNREPQLHILHKTDGDVSAPTCGLELHLLVCSSCRIQLQIERMSRKKSGCKMKTIVLMCWRTRRRLILRSNVCDECASRCQQPQSEKINGIATICQYFTFRCDVTTRSVPSTTRTHTLAPVPTKSECKIIWLRHFQSARLIQEIRSSYKTNHFACGLLVLVPLSHFIRFLRIVKQLIIPIQRHTSHACLPVNLACLPACLILTAILKLLIWFVYFDDILPVASPHRV